MPEDVYQVELSLLGAFALCRLGHEVRVNASGERLLALLALHALHARPVSRRIVAGTLWPEKPEERAAGNLRTVIWRLPAGLVEATATHLSLAAGVRCDVAELVARTRRLTDPASGLRPADLDHELYDADLLPAWSEDWVAIERERIRQLRIHALDALSARLTAAGRYSDAIAAGLTSVAAEPLRESAHRQVITAHLAEGNYGEAIRHYHRFRALLADELSLEPSPKLTQLIQGATRRVTAG
jgi:DNA-binding SARP family transcriptional activator